MLLDSDERLAENDLEELVGGKKKLQIKAKIEIWDQIILLCF